jgi:type I restriction enzyme M protein
MKDGPKNRLRDCDIHKIVDVFNKQTKRSQATAAWSAFEEIEKNEFNLNIPRYIDSQQSRRHAGHRRAT